MVGCLDSVGVTLLTILKGEEGKMTRVKIIFYFKELFDLFRAFGDICDL